ncbi:radical SAM protein [Telmatospirillum sp. J64-1]|uniref:radical SAM protein n=1 Tax=Telmatospirillum sp. J64-1 TaxID=2502183 RepID=UPI00115CF88B|nr:radical SAM protein [Telmatospirillum sp. J64-1]
MTFYDMPLYRPPSEGDNLIVQATLGCSFNQCSFCSMYKSKEYRARPLEDVFRDIDILARHRPQAHRVFLADGDALVLDMDSLRAILDKLAATFSDLQRVTCYATPQNILKKSEEELRELIARRLTLVYLGIESGSDVMLKRITKGSAKQMRMALEKARAVGLKVSATVILGLGGRKHWQEHIEETAALINQAPPNFLSTLQLHLDPEVSPRFHERFGEPFAAQDDRAILREQRLLLERLDPPNPVIFRSNHASNCLPLAGTLPKDRDKLLAIVDAALQGQQKLRPLLLRGL